MTIITAEAEIMLTLLQVKLLTVDKSTKAEPSTLEQTIHKNSYISLFFLLCLWYLASDHMKTNESNLKREHCSGETRWLSYFHVKAS